MALACISNVPVGTRTTSLMLIIHSMVGVSSVNVNSGATESSSYVSLRFVVSHHSTADQGGRAASKVVRPSVCRSTEFLRQCAQPSVRWTWILAHQRDKLNNSQQILA